ncbi:hypothetical protein KUCAC02_035401 [Chaenocephalus aceratus]|nr:hypothetical protein KUCAC02_035401 [Chaenocephalus aceratus]
MFLSHRRAPQSSARARRCMTSEMSLRYTASESGFRVASIFLLRLSHFCLVHSPASQPVTGKPRALQAFDTRWIDGYASA